MNKEFAKLGEEQRNQLLQMHKEAWNTFQEQGEAFRSRRKLDWEGQRGWLMKRLDLLYPLRYPWWLAMVEAALSYCSDTSLEQAVPHPSWDTTLMLLLPFYIYSEKLNSQNISLQGLLWNWRPGSFSRWWEMLFQSKHRNTVGHSSQGQCQVLWNVLALSSCPRSRAVNLRHERSASFRLSRAED